MIRLKHISGSLILMNFAIYFTFGDPDCDLWGSFFFANQFFAGCYLCHMLLRCQREKSMQTILKMIYGISLFEFVLNAYSIINVDVFNKINRGHEIGGVFLFSLTIFTYYELAKR